MDAVESINLAFAIPIGTVLGLALLVFALGFRAPVQPPSFDQIFDKESPDRKKRLKKPKKAVINGQVLEAKSTDSSPGTIKSKKPTKVEDTTVSPKPKSRKVTKPAKVEEKNVADAEIVEGEWTTAMSRKERKIRSKYETEKENEKSEEESKDEQTASPTVPQVAAPTTDSPQQRKKKEKKKKESPPPVATPVVEEKKEELPPIVSSATIESEGATEDILVSPECDTAISSHLPKDIQNEPSPKKAKEKKRRKSPEARNLPSTNVESSSTEAAPLASNIQPLDQPSTLGATSDETIAAVVEPQDEVRSDATAKEPVSFNEIDAWEEAKPQKKKKKPRREN